MDNTIAKELLKISKTILAGGRLFHELKVGEKFHTGKSKGTGAMKDVESWLEYEKISPSKAKITGQVGYGNARMVGSIQPFSPKIMVYSL